MKNFSILFLFFLGCISGFAQQIVLVFTGHDISNNSYIQLSRVEVTDLTQGWSENLTYPDTVAILSIGTGIDENMNQGEFSLSQNNPNPFCGSTIVGLSVPEPGVASIEITDVNGRTVSTQCFSLPQPGFHQFRIETSRTGLLFLTAKLNEKSSSIKMICSEKGGNDEIEYCGCVGATMRPQQDKRFEKSSINYAFSYGDAMTFKGYVTIDGEEFESEIVAQSQFFSESITLNVQTIGMPCPSTPSMTDVDGNVYQTVFIGGQCWMKENLRTSRYADSTLVALGNDTSSNLPYRYYPANNSSNVLNYGYLYNWKAVMGKFSSSSTNPSYVQGICPTGWHIPSDLEWQQLTDYVSSQNNFCCYNVSSNIAKALASTANWNSVTYTCAVGCNQSSNNSTGFNAMPAGYYGSIGYNNISKSIHIWSCTESDSNTVYDRGITFDQSSVFRQNYSKTFGFSVRCLRDE